MTNKTKTNQWEEEFEKHYGLSFEDYTLMLLAHQRKETLDSLKMNKRKEPETLHSYDPSSGQTFPDIEKAVDRGYNQAVDEFNTKLSTLREKEVGR